MTLYERYNTGDDDADEVYGAGWRAQTFTVGNTGTNEDHYVTSIKLKVGRLGSPGTITVGIRTVDGEGKPTGDDLCSADYNGNMLPPPPMKVWAEFTFTTAVLLSASTQYAIVVRVPGGDSSNYVAWMMDSSSPTYTGGYTVVSNNSGSTWIRFINVDYMFEEYGTAITTDLCSWIDDKGGPSGLTIPDVFEIVNSYLFETPPPGYSFVPTLQNVFGISDYYLGLNGDAATGCDFFP